MGVSSTVNLAYTVFAFFGFVLAAVPIYWQLEVWNVGACSYLAWTAIQCLIVFVNTIVWRDNVINWAPVWCDISTKITIGTGIALQAASLCINRRLYLISKSPAAGVGSGSGRRRIIMADLSICLGIPLVFMILHYICQGHRFNIFEGLGCTASTYFTPVTWAIFVPWPIVVSLISSIYGGLTIYRFSRIEKTFDELRGQRTSLTKRRYLRLMTIASGEIVCGLPILLFNLAITTQSPTYPWISWEDTHYNFSRVIQVPAVEWRSVGELFVFVKTSLLLPPLAAVLFVVFSGLVGDAVRNYRVPLDFVANRCCFWRKVVPTPTCFVPPPPTGAKPVTISMTASEPTSQSRNHWCPSASLDVHDLEAGSPEFTLKAETDHTSASSVTSQYAKRHSGGIVRGDCDSVASPISVSFRDGPREMEMGTFDKTISILNNPPASTRHSTKPAINIHPPSFDEPGGHVPIITGSDIPSNIATHRLDDSDSPSETREDPPGLDYNRSLS